MKKTKTVDTSGNLRLKRGQDGYYMSIPAQGSTTRRFWSYAGKTRREAEKTVANFWKPVKYKLLPAKERKIIWDCTRGFRRAEMEKFNREHCLAFYTDHPWLFTGANRNNNIPVMLDAAGLRYAFITTAEILKGHLEKHSVIYCPGGFGYFPDKKLKKIFVDHVRAGGGLIGVCAGAFFALKNALGVCRSDFTYFRESGIADVILNPRDPVARGIESAARKVVYALYHRHPQARQHTVRLKMLRGNGPLFIPRGGDKAVGFFDSTAPYAAIVRAGFGRGRVVLFSTHPDYDMVELKKRISTRNIIEGVKLFKNAVLYCAHFKEVKRPAPRRGACLRNSAEKP